jgi:hypothetical protein
MREVRRAARLLALPTIGVLVILAFVPGRLELAIRVYALLVSAVALSLGTSVLRRSYPLASALRVPAGRRRERQRREIPGALARLENEVALGTTGSFGLHLKLRPRLRELASDLLAVRRGISLERDPARARAVLGDETWDLIRDDRPPPEDRLASGIPSPVLVRIVESLERL